MAGRPRTFDEGQVLEAAMMLFWEQGYEGTSLAQLRDAAGLSSASLYGAFGSKQGLFERVVEHYASRPRSVVSLSAGDKLATRDALARLLHDSIDEQADPSHPLGCLVALSATVGSEEAIEAGRTVSAQRQRDREAIQGLLARTADAGLLARDVDVDALTLALHAFILGIATELRDGVEIKKLHRTAGLLLRWATGPGE